jgi:hypothetical protein
MLEHLQNVVQGQTAKGTRKFCEKQMAAKCISERNEICHVDSIPGQSLDVNNEEKLQHN